jgi:hypothetical protein
MRQAESKTLPAYTAAAPRLVFHDADKPFHAEPGTYRGRFSASERFCEIIISSAAAKRELCALMRFLIPSFGVFVFQKHFKYRLSIVIKPAHKVRIQHIRHACSSIYSTHF